jgi:hypothetical protein
VSNDVVAHFLDGSLVKGVSLNIDPGKPTCHIRTPEKGMVEVRLADLKALFFVRSFDGDPVRRDESRLASDDPRRIGAHPVEVEFRDGERLVALTPHFPLTRNLFYALPADRTSNNERVLVNQAACVAVKAAPSGAPRPDGPEGPRGRD